MMTEEYEDKAGRRVWLSRSEVEQLLNVADDPLRKVAFRLAAEVGLRSHEVGEVRPEHVVDGGEAGKMLVVPEGRQATRSADPGLARGHRRRGGELRRRRRRRRKCRD
jgi:integrase